VLFPSAANFIGVCLDQDLSSPKLALFHTHILRHFDARLKPELRLAIGAMHVDVHSRLLARKKVEAESAFAKDCRAHAIGEYGMQANVRVNAPLSDAGFSPRHVTVALND
jgi:hypothetical protein